MLTAENLDHRVPGDLTIRVSVDEENNEHASIPDMPNKVGTVDATLAGCSSLLLMMYKVIKHIFNKYYHFMLICILHYLSMLLVINYYIFKYSYFLYRYYTPLGSWVSTKILMNVKLMDNMKKNIYELLLNDVGNHEASLNDPMYNIRYNSETNH
ncbi:hypothetical protein PVIIG_05794 [Plasmodium vivax India VII]|uniref:Uncharacterized protein n=4 Tax=Plasmodium vivax TaxID=5855 RepID=A0A0J9T6N5_PLAVI|nr:hypothetical protein PVIIG_05794 [Plasmodium vivax India VII]KMZ89407.1 hypothetical protein PVBG_05918 [Plasmodium vivax Brazil I]KMZ91130.1 hypothetical protein PVMG_00004 [Plasmodium vivax Mauritania I]KMZ96428.1 hypothetical protein PVNG_05963 [Plasmodium vivax North Korean]